jgi:hypothetical protein
VTAVKLPGLTLDDGPFATSSASDLATADAVSSILTTP